MALATARDVELGEQLNRAAQNTQTLTSEEKAEREARVRAHLTKTENARAVSADGPNSHQLTGA